MSNTKKPPSKRAQMIYCRIMIEGRAVELVSRDLAITPRTVKETVRRVKRWLRASRSWLPDDDFDPSHETLRQVHLARLEHQWEQAMNAWYRSLSMEETQKLHGEETGKRKVEKILHSQTGDVKYLDQAREILREIRELVGPSSSINHRDHDHVETLTLEERTAALDHLLETLGQRAGEEKDGGADSRCIAAAGSAGEILSP